MIGTIHFVISNTKNISLFSIGRRFYTEIQANGAEKEFPMNCARRPHVPRADCAWNQMAQPGDTLDFTVFVASFDLFYDLVVSKAFEPHRFSRGLSAVSERETGSNADSLKESLREFSPEDIESCCSYFVAIHDEIARGQCSILKLCSKNCLRFRILSQCRRGVSPVCRRDTHNRGHSLG